MSTHGKWTGNNVRKISTTNHPEWYHCPNCGKRTYNSRKDARRIARRMVTGPRASAYECAPDTGRWHTGRLAQGVVYGHATRGEIYGDRAAA